MSIPSENDEALRLAHERTFLASERNRLANERTFLAWVRTGLTCIATGLGIAQFLIFQSSIHRLVAHIIGAALILLGMAMFILSFLDYRTGFVKFSTQNGYASGISTIAVLSFVLVIIAGVLLWLIWH